MSAEPLTPEEREEIIAQMAAFGDVGSMIDRRWDATVRAETARADAERERAEVLRAIVNRLLPVASDAIEGCAWVELAYEAEAKDAVEAAVRALADDQRREGRDG